MRPYQLLFLGVGILFACGRSNQKKAALPLQAPPTVAALKQATDANTESFDSFNTRFHADKGFQMARIAFPIGGQSVNDEEAKQWTPDNWEFLKTPVTLDGDTLECRHSLVMSDSLVTEKFWIDQSGFKVERRFKVQDGRWFLVYYDDINM
jgi:hypothetical protein